MPKQLCCFGISASFKVFLGLRAAAAKKRAQKVSASTRGCHRGVKRSRCVYTL